jgi:hypothetical protein
MVHLLLCNFSTFTLSKSQKREKTTILVRFHMNRAQRQGFIYRRKMFCFSGVPKNGNAKSKRKV